MTTTTPRATGECHACHRYGYASLAAQPDGRWLCRDCEDDVSFVAAGGTVEFVPCPECCDPTRPMRSRCPACGGTRKVRRLVPAPAPTRTTLSLADLTIIECGVSHDEAAMLAAGGAW